MVNSHFNNKNSRIQKLLNIEHCWKREKFLNEQKTDAVKRKKDQVNKNN